ncbi:unnamed protein product [Paramecium primaurelia]|uniref:Protein kinase domain-containing protein n=1 Tax=Paramecium primaurelia TaxID=5886 RepID=A0A8S1L4P1_PARPR|nr:unnamed protein product [Paramecium primaurelia]
MIVLFTLKQYNSYSQYIGLICKAENLLLKNNVIKLCDFGWSAKVGYNKQRDTLCGTVYYMAPQISQRQQSQ